MISGKTKKTYIAFLDSICTHGRTGERANVRIRTLFGLLLFFCFISFVTFMYLFFLTMKKLAKSTLSLFRRFSRFAGMTCALVAKDSRKRWMISVVLLVNCEWTVDWRLVIRFSIFFFFFLFLYHRFEICFTSFVCASLA